MILFRVDSWFFWLFIFISFMICLMLWDIFMGFIVLQAFFADKVCNSITFYDSMHWDLLQYDFKILNDIEYINIYISYITCFWGVCDSSLRVGLMLSMWHHLHKFWGCHLFPLNLILVGWRGLGLVGTLTILPLHFLFLICNHLSFRKLLRSLVVNLWLTYLQLWLILLHSQMLLKINKCNFLF